MSSISYGEEIVINGEPVRETYTVFLYDQGCWETHDTSRYRNLPFEKTVDSPIPRERKKSLFQNPRVINLRGAFPIKFFIRWLHTARTNTASYNLIDPPSKVCPPHQLFILCNVFPIAIHNFYVS